MVRIMILVKEGFEKDLLDAADHKDNPYAELDLLMSDVPKEERVRRKEEYFLDNRIMKAATLDEISDITFEQILDCISSSELFASLFVKQKARYYIDHFERVRSVRTLRKRRVL